MSDREDNSAVSRRDFLMQSGATILSVGVLGSFSRAFAEEETFQYIVVGSGAGGGPLCANLAKAGKKVLLLEAGDATENNNYKVPAFWGASTEDPNFAWSFYGKQNSRYDKFNSNFTPGKGVLYPRASTLGGCTAHNAMITMYPDQRDWENLVDVTGDRSWSAENMRGYYQRLEEARYLDSSEAVSKRRGKKGWLKVERTDPRLAGKDPVLRDFVIACGLEAGTDRTILERIAKMDDESLLELMKSDPNDWDFVTRGQTGLVTTPKATLRGRRSGTREAILEAKARYPRNFKIQTNSLVTKVLFQEGSNTKVIGVEYLEGKSLYEADPRSSEGNRKKALNYQVRKIAKLAKGGEVILCGGAFNTPQLLMLSGIGPARELERHHIPVRVELDGVGQNLQDRYEVGVITRLKKPLELLKGCTFGQKGDACLEEYSNNAEKSFYGTNGLVMGVKKRSKEDGRDADLYLFALPGYFKGYHPGWAAAALKADHISWVVLKGHTANTAGSVTLNSADPTATPDINFRYFKDGNDKTGDDLDAVVEGVRHVRRINRRMNFRSHTVEEAFPGNKVKTEQDVREFIQRDAFGHHASCSNKMGTASDPMAVVDSKFRVHGVKNLRVVDASVFPKIPGLFIVVPTYMIAEKASDVILRGE